MQQPVVRYIVGDHVRIYPDSTEDDTKCAVVIGVVNDAKLVALHGPRQDPAVQQCAVADMRLMQPQSSDLRNVATVAMRQLRRLFSDIDAMRGEGVTVDVPQLIDAAEFLLAMSQHAVRGNAPLALTELRWLRAKLVDCVSLPAVSGDETALTAMLPYSLAAAQLAKRIEAQVEFAQVVTGAVDRLKTVSRMFEECVAPPPACGVGGTGGVARLEKLKQMFAEVIPDALAVFARAKARSAAIGGPIMALVQRANLAADDLDFALGAFRLDAVVRTFR